MPPNQNEAGLQHFFHQLLILTGPRKEDALAGLLAYAAAHQDEETFALVTSLAAQYPGDVGLFSPLLLNVVTLQPGQAMYLDACTPHAYVRGTGLEIMANSDNVLRAGLTPKYIDVAELLDCTRCLAKPDDQILLSPAWKAPCSTTTSPYRTSPSASTRPVSMHSPPPAPRSCLPSMAPSSFSKVSSHCAWRRAIRLHPRRHRQLPAAGRGPGRPCWQPLLRRHQQHRE